MAEITKKEFLELLQEFSDKTLDQNSRRSILNLKKWMADSSRSIHDSQSSRIILLAVSIKNPSQPAVSKGGERVQPLHSFIIFVAQPTTSSA